MPVLASFSYPQGEGFSLTRGYLPAWAIGWQPDAIALTSGNPTVLKEFSFGGYELHIELKDWIYDWDNRQFTLGELFENYYVIPPGGGGPSSAGPVTVLWEWVSDFNCPVLVIVNPAPVDHYYWQLLPPATRPYWAPPPQPPGSFPRWVP